MSIPAILSIFLFCVWPLALLGVGYFIGRRRIRIVWDRNGFEDDRPTENPAPRNTVNPGYATRK